MNKTKITLRKGRFVFRQKRYISTGWSLFNPLQSWKHEEILTKKSSEFPDETIILEGKIYRIWMSRICFITLGGGVECMAEKIVDFSTQHWIHVFSTSDSSKFTNNQNAPTFISLVLGSGNMISVEIWSSIQVLKGLLLSLVKKQYLNSNTRKQNRRKLIQAHKRQKDKSKNTKWHFKHARPRLQRMLRPNGPGSWKISLEFGLSFCIKKDLWKHINVYMGIGIHVNILLCVLNFTLR